MDPKEAILAFINEIAPEHGRTSCSDENSGGNEYFNESGYSRCVRCCLLHRLKNGEWPYGATFTVELIRTYDGGRRSECLEWNQKEPKS